MLVDRCLRGVAQGFQDGGLGETGCAFRFDLPRFQRCRGRKPGDHQGEQRKDQCVASLLAGTGSPSGLAQGHVRPITHVMSAAAFDEQPVLSAATSTARLASFTTVVPIRISRARPWVPLITLEQSARGMFG